MESALIVSSNDWRDTSVVELIQGYVSAKDMHTYNMNNIHTLSYTAHTLIDDQR